MFHDLEGRGVLPIVSEKNFALRDPPLDMPKSVYSLGTLEHWNKTSLLLCKSNTYLVANFVALGTNGTTPLEQNKFGPHTEILGTGLAVTGLTK